MPAWKIAGEDVLDRRHLAGQGEVPGEQGGDLLLRRTREDLADPGEAKLFDRGTGFGVQPNLVGGDPGLQPGPFPLR